MRTQVAVIIAALALAPALARAAEEPMSAEADARFKEGASFAKQGRYEEARAKYIEVLALAPTAKVLLNLAVVEEASGHPREALQHARQYLANPNADPARSETVKRELVPELLAKTAHVRVKAEPGADVVVDKTEHFRAPLAEAIDVMPGPHTIEAGGKTLAFDLVAGAERDVDLSAAVRDTQPPPIPAKETSGRTAFTAASITAFSLAAIGVGVAIGTGVAAKSRSDDADTLANELGSSSSVCAASSDPRCIALLSARSDARSLTGAAVGAGIAAGAVAIAGVVLLVVRPSKSAASPTVRAGVSSVSLSWNF